MKTLMMLLCCLFLTVDRMVASEPRKNAPNSPSTVGLAVMNEQFGLMSNQMADIQRQNQALEAQNQALAVSVTTLLASVKALTEAHARTETRLSELFKNRTFSPEYVRFVERSNQAFRDSRAEERERRFRDPANRPTGWERDIHAGGCSY